LLIAGETGGGKSELAYYIADRMQPIRLIVFDVKDELDFGVERCYDAAGLREALRNPIVHFVPRSFDRDTIEAVCKLVWETAGPWLWWVDEAAALTKPGYIPWGMHMAATQGRSQMKMLMALCQRLAEIHPCLRSEATHLIVFVPPPILLDLRTLAGHVGIEADQLRATLEHLEQRFGRYAHWWFIKDGRQHRLCAPLPLDVIHGAPVGQPQYPAGHPSEAAAEGLPAPAPADTSLPATTPAEQP
jgi:hypothetical protein